MKHQQQLLKEKKVIWVNKIKAHSSEILSIAVNTC